MHTDESNDVLFNRSLIEKWFVLLERLITGLQLAYVEFRGDVISNGSLVITFPQDIEQTDELALAAQLAYRSDAPVTGTGKMAADGSQLLRIAYPLHLNSKLEGVIVVEVNASLSDQSTILKSLVLGKTWLDFTLNPYIANDSPASLSAVIDAGCTYENFDDVLVAVLAELTGQVQCTRIALGRKDHDKLLIEAVSGVSHLSHSSARTKAVQQTMQEAIDAGCTLAWPLTSDNQSSSMLSEFVQSYQLAGACIVPLIQGFNSPLVFLFEYADSADWNDGIKQRCDEAARFTAPLIEWKREQNRPWWRRFLSLFRDGLRQLTGAENRLRHLFVAAGIIGFLYLAMGHADHRVSAPAVIEGAIQRAVVAPYDGFIELAEVRAGQMVAVGDLLARLDDRELQEKRRRLQAEAAELVKQHRQAVATLNRSEASIVNAQIEQAQSRLQLVEDQLQRIELRAPFDGRIISGDWSRSLGMPISRGDVIFEVAPMDAYRIALKVSDRDISDLAANQTGEVILSAQPHQPIPITLTEITTLANNDSTEPTFRVEAEPTETLVALRPGMEGLAKVSVGQRRRWWIWTHTLTDWVRLQLWRWMP